MEHEGQVRLQPTLGTRAAEQPSYSRHACPEEVPSVTEPLGVGLAPYHLELFGNPNDAPAIVKELRRPAIRVQLFGQLAQPFIWALPHRHGRGRGYASRLAGRWFEPSRAIKESCFGKRVFGLAQVRSSC